MTGWERAARRSWTLIAALLVLGGGAEAAMSPGEKTFIGHCGTCHAKEADAPPRQGPNLFGVIGRKAGSVDGFRYTPVLKDAGFDWTAEKLDLWITDAKAMIPGTSMLYKQAKPEIRARIIEYIGTLK